MTAVRKLATYQDVLDAPPHQVAEIINGNLSLHPRPAPRHAGAASTLQTLLGGPFDVGPPGGWILLVEPEIHVPIEGAEPDIMVPDIGGWLLETMSELPEESFFSIVPDWVCEVLSPKTARLDKLEKMPAYHRHGVNYFWMVDPIHRTLEAFGWGKEAWTRIGVWADADRARIEPFQELELDLSLLWRHTKKVV